MKSQEGILDTSKIKKRKGDDPIVEPQQFTIDEDN